MNGDAGQREWVASAGEATNHTLRDAKHPDGGPTGSHAASGQSGQGSSSGQRPSGEPTISRARLAVLLAVSLCATAALGIAAFTSIGAAIDRTITRAFGDPVAEEYFTFMNRTVIIAGLLCAPLAICAHLRGMAAVRALPARRSRVGFAFLSVLTLVAGVWPAEAIIDAIEGTLPPVW
ncbi:MAG: hypothetical protein Q3979_05985 [Actinomycetaceae bacterium]|nr:hypothetical protein [Actinomycetaceae bacterium]